MDPHVTYFVFPWYAFNDFFITFNLCFFVILQPNLERMHVYAIFVTNLLHLGNQRVYFLTGSKQQHDYNNKTFVLLLIHLQAKVKNIKEKVD